MTSWQEWERLKVLEKRRKEHEQYAAERLAKVNAICKRAWLNGMSYGRYVAERSKIMDDMDEENKVLTTNEETPKKHGIREPLTAEKISEVQALIDSGATIAETAEQAGVGKSTVSRIKSGAYGAKKPPKAAEPTEVTTPEVSKTSTTGFLRELISRAVETLRDTQGDTPDDCARVGKALGLLTAAELIMGDNAKI